MNFIEQNSIDIMNKMLKNYEALKKKLSTFIPETVCVQFMKEVIPGSVLKSDDSFSDTIRPYNLLGLNASTERGNTTAELVLPEIPITKRMISVKEVSEKDLSRLADYLPTQPQFFPTTRETWERRFDIWWASNPAFTPQFPRGWILETETSIAGFIGSIPIKFLMYGEEKTAVAAVDWYVDPSVRGFSSIKLLNEYLKQKNASLFLYNTDEQELRNLLYKNKFKEYVLPKYETKYYFILNKYKIILILIRLNILKRCGSFTSLWEMLKEIKSFVCGYIHQKPLARLSPLCEKEYSISLCTSCNDSFSRIWGSSVTRCDVTMSRDIKTLNWLYFSSIKPSDRVVIQCRRTQDNSLAGYMVFDIQRTKPWSEIALMKLMDMCIEKNDLNVITLLLQFAVETGKQNNAGVLELWALDEETETYLKSLFRIRRESQHHNLFKLSYIHEAQSEYPTICPSMIAPPRGVAH